MTSLAQMRINSRLHYLANKVSSKARSTAWRFANPDKWKVIRKKHRAAPRVQAEHTASIMWAHAAKMNRVPSWADREKIELAYKVARYLQDGTGVRMSVDHIVPMQGKLVSGLHVHENLRPLPWAVNKLKHNTFPPLA
jgi:hypothetical protein